MSHNLVLYFPVLLYAGFGNLLPLACHRETREACCLYEKKNSPHLLKGKTDLLLMNVTKGGGRLASKVCQWMSGLVGPRKQSDRRSQ